MSSKKDREKRREERIAAETKVSSSDRRTKLLQMAAGFAFLVIAAVVVVIVVSSASSGSSGDTNLEEVATVNRFIGNTPQQGLVLGDPKAKVELVEFGDLQCPICKAYSEEILPQVIENKIKTGQAKLAFRVFPIISEASVPAGAAAIAAGAQGRGWNFIELFYRNQGKEHTNYVNDEFLAAIAKGAGVKNIAKFEKESKAKKGEEEVAKSNEEAGKFGFTGTPSFVIRGPGTNGYELLPSTEDPKEFEKEIEEAS